MFKRLIVIFALLTTAYLYVIDQSGNFILPVYGRIQCWNNVTLLLNNVTGTVYVLCHGNTFDASDLRHCSGYSQFTTIVLRDCLLSTSEIRETLENYKPEGFILDSKGILPRSDIIISDMPILQRIGLFVRENVTYRFESLFNVYELNLVNVRKENLLKELLSDLISVKNINLVLGKIKSLPEDTFRGFSEIISLNFFRNQLEKLPETLFNGLTALERINLSGNLLTFLPDTIFSGLVNINEILLTDNLLTYLSPILFRDNVNLFYLAIENNTFSSLPELLFQNNYNLNFLFACNCNMIELPERIFSSSASLTFVSLCQNKLSRLYPDTFANNSYLSMVDLYDNHLSELPHNIFAKNKRLSMLFLNGNLLEKISDIFQNNDNLQQLYLDRNKIKEVEEYPFRTLKKLTFIDLESNVIRFVHGKTPFGRSPYLQSVRLSMNNISEFPALDWSVYNIKVLNLSYNRISKLNLERLPSGNKITIALQNNIISTITGNMVGDMRYVILDNNPLRCDCALKDFIERIRLSAINKPLFCYEPLNLKNKSLFDLSPSYVVCPVEENCPQRCRCYRQKDLSVLVNCSSSNMFQTPSLLPSNSTVVHLEHNFLSDLGYAKSWSNVTNLYLDYNDMNPLNLWNLPPSLKYLSLRHNQLDFLSSEFLKMIDGLPLLQLDIRDNQFWCNCSFLYFKFWFDQNIDKLVEADQIMCSRLFPDNNTKANYPLINFPADAFCPPDLPALSLPVIVSISIISVITVLAIVCIVIFYKYKTIILPYVYVHFPRLYCFIESEPDVDKIFDAFISYTGSDREIAMSILQELEGKPPFFKLCIHERDWLPGPSIMSQIEASVRNSRKIILLVSEAFLNSMWCETEFQLAYLQSLEDKVDRLIIVLNESSTRYKMPPDMQQLLTTKINLVWGEKWFWEKLRYSLPRYCVQKSQQHRMPNVDSSRNSRLV